MAAASEENHSLSDLNIKLDSEYDLIISEIIEKGVGNKIEIKGHEFTIFSLKFFDDDIIDKYLNSKVIPSKAFDEEKKNLIDFGKDVIHKISYLELVSSKNIRLKFIHHSSELRIDHWCFYIDLVDESIKIEDMPNNVNIGIASTVTFTNDTEYGYDTAHYGVFDFNYFDDVISKIKLSLAQGKNPTRYVAINLSHSLEFFFDKGCGEMSRIDFVCQ